MSIREGVKTFSDTPGRPSSRLASADLAIRPGRGLGEPGPSGSPISSADHIRQVIASLQEVIDNLSRLSMPDGGADASPAALLPLLLDAAGAAQLLSLTRAHVCEMARRGEIPAVRVGRSVRIPRDRLLVWIHERTDEPKWMGGIRLPGWASLALARESKP